MRSADSIDCIHVNHSPSSCGSRSSLFQRGGTSCLTDGLLAALLFAGCAKESPKPKGRSGRGSGPSPVRVTEAVSKAVPVEVKTFGAVEAFATVVIKSQITGILTNVAFRDGQDVRQGDVLFQIDSVPSEIALRQAEAGAAKDKVLFENALRESQREEELLKKDFTSRNVYDQAKANADALAASVRSSGAAVDNARLQLSYCTIRSPVSGRTGKIAVQAGNLVNANETALVTINQIQPIKVTFTIPEQDLGGIQAQMNSRPIEVKVLLPDAPDKPETGQLAFIDNAVDRSSGTIALNATFPNEAGRLWPGQFVTVNLVMSVQKDAIVVPFRAVQTGQKGTYLFLVGPDASAEMRSVKVGRHIDQECVIEGGLKAGERVVTDGQQRLEPGAKVEIQTGAPSRDTSGAL